MHFCEEKSKLLLMFYFLWSSYSPLRILRGIRMNVFIISIQTMIWDVRLKWCQWCIFDSWRTEISSPSCQTYFYTKSWKERKKLYRWNYETDFSLTQWLQLMKCFHLSGWTAGTHSIFLRGTILQSFLRWWWCLVLSLSYNTSVTHLHNTNICGASWWK